MTLQAGSTYIQNVCDHDHEWSYQCSAPSFTTTHYRSKRGPEETARTIPRASAKTLAKVRKAMIAEERANEETQ